MRRGLLGEVLEPLARFQVDLLEYAMHCAADGAARRITISGGPEVRVVVIVQRRGGAEALPLGLLLDELRPLRQPVVAFLDEFSAALRRLVGQRGPERSLPAGLQAVGIDDLLGLAGALGDQVAGTNYGAAYVYVRESGVWSAKSKLIASDQNSQEGGTLGESVALSGDCIIAGDPNDDDHGDGAGAAYIYEKPGGGWSYPAQLTETAKVTAAGQGASEGDWFGTAVAIEGYTAVVGSPNDDNHPINQGSVHVFERISGTWTTVPVAKLIQRNPIGDADLGSSVAISGDWIVAGSCYAHGSVNRAGAACFYKKPPAGWKNASETDIVEASDGETYDAFGRSVSIDGDYALVGADLDDDPEFGSWTPSSAGSAYIFYLDE